MTIEIAEELGRIAALVAATPSNPQAGTVEAILARVRASISALSAQTPRPRAVAVPEILRDLVRENALADIDCVLVRPENYWKVTADERLEIDRAIAAEVAFLARVAEAADGSGPLTIDLDDPSQPDAQLLRGWLDSMSNHAEDLDLDAPVEDTAAWLDVMHAIVDVNQQLRDLDSGPTDLTREERAALAESCAIEADGIAQDNAGSHDPSTFGWVHDLVGMVDTMDDLRAGRPLRRDDATRDALDRVRVNQLTGVDDAGASPEDVAAHEARAELVRRAIALSEGPT